MKAEWFVEKNGRTHGPFTGAQLQKLAAAQQLLPGDVIWKEGMTRKIQAEQVPGLFKANQQTPERAPVNVPPTALPVVKVSTQAQENFTSRSEKPSDPSPSIKTPLDDPEVLEV